MLSGRWTTPWRTAAATRRSTRTRAIRLYDERLAPWFHDDVAETWPSQRKPDPAAWKRNGASRKSSSWSDPDSLQESDRLRTETSRMLRDGFLQQNTTSEIDASCPLPKQHGMLSLLLEFRGRGCGPTVEGTPRPRTRHPRAQELAVSAVPADHSQGIGCPSTAMRACLRGACGRRRTGGRRRTWLLLTTYLQRLEGARITRPDGIRSLLKRSAGIEETGEHAFGDVEHAGEEHLRLQGRNRELVNSQSSKSIPYCLGKRQDASISEVTLLEEPFWAHPARFQEQAVELPAANPDHQLHDFLDSVSFSSSCVGSPAGTARFRPRCHGPRRSR